MIQIAPDKCPSDSSDYDPEINIGIGARYVENDLDRNNRVITAATGNYNDWYFDLAVALANDYAVCTRHSNLGYLQNMFSGYLQGFDVSGLNMASTTIIAERASRV
ncbi:glycoside hydrolase family 23 protein [Serendipita vermifera MAFF 305830]|uniref:Glycoside hydrolase family 23 protein n=1 Tax=Serendipita vermifera MAFF 305830 TaxID=933852 RepID=A0A0C2WVZ1_SERVB|nr:glycoside hydrolase family 23 protein [Serendipita vermifera MAFF 305830]